MTTRYSSTVVCNESKTTFVSSDGRVYVLGGVRNRNTIAEERLIPTIIPFLNNIVAIATGDYHTVCLDFHGNVYGFGSNGQGQLGLGKDVEDCTLKPQKVKLPSIKQVSCGDSFTVCLSDDGDLYSFGANDNGQLGLGEDGDCFFPKKIECLKDVDFVHCSYDSAFCKDLNNDVFCWGNNWKGQLGIGGYDTQYTPVKCSLWPKDVIDIKSGKYHTLVLTATQEVYSCGRNYNGQLGFQCSSVSKLKKIAALANIIRIECGKEQSMCIDIDNNFYLFGSNNYGQLGLGDAKNCLEPTIHPSLLNVIDISNGGNHSFVKT